MNATTRIVTSLGLVLICYFCIYVPLKWIAPDLDATNRRILGLGVSTLIGAFLFFISKNRSRKFVIQILRTGLIVGVIGFTIGFIGPIIFSI